MSGEWGPLGALAGEWEGDAGLDSAFSHARREAVSTPFHERASLTPFGPVVNGSQRLFGLDHRTSMCRQGETTPFHMELGYWLWDAASGEVVRCFVVPRGVTVLAGGAATADAVEFSLAADLDGASYTIAQNEYLAKRASVQSYRNTVTINADGTWTYHEVTMLQFSERPEPFVHADTNTLRRVA
jgi:hypothetical protein